MGFAVSLFKVPHRRRGLLVTGIKVVNIVFTGLALNVTLFGEVFVPCLLSYCMVKTTIVWKKLMYLTFTTTVLSDIDSLVASLALICIGLMLC